MSFNRSIVKLDIGGTVFKTSKSTLTRFDGFFKIMMETDIPLTIDETGAIFIDRSPKHFDLILNYMRDGDVTIPESSDARQEIQKEAQFYLLDDLVELCSARGRSVMKLNIGGTRFETTVSTLTIVDGFFKSHIGSAHFRPDKTLFVDRCPQQFHRILKFLRDGHVALPESMEALEDILTEAKFYKLEGLIQFCRMELVKRDRIERTAFNKKVVVLENDAQLLQLITDPLKPLLIIYYHIDEDGRTVQPEGFSIEWYLDRYTRKIDVYFRPFTNHDELASKKGSPQCSWHWSLHSPDGAYKHQYPAYNNKGNMKYGKSFGDQLNEDVQQFLADYGVKL